MGAISTVIWISPSMWVSLFPFLCSWIPKSLMAAAVTKSRSEFCYSIVSCASLLCLSSACLILEQQNECGWITGLQFQNKSNENLSSRRVTLDPQWSEEEQQQQQQQDALDSVYADQRKYIEKIVKVLKVKYHKDCPLISKGQSIFLIHYIPFS